MKSKTIFLLLMVVLSSLMICSVSAGFLDDVFEQQPQNVTYNGVTFNIPENFEEYDLNMTDMSVEDDWGNAADFNYYAFTDFDNNVYCIGIGDFNKNLTSDDLGDGKMIEINGQQGCLEKDDDLYTFAYLADNDTVVVLFSQDKSLFEEIIPEV